MAAKTSRVVVPKVKLNNGLEMPVMGLGTYETKENEALQAVKSAIDAGYRHIDTSYYYQNEEQVGKAIRLKIAEGVVKREDVFVCTKLWLIHYDPEKVEPACKHSLENLGLGYIDLYLMHFPVGYNYLNEETFHPKDEGGKLLLSDVDYLTTYREMEKLVKKGLVRSIGVANFNSVQVQRLLDNCEIKPVTNQVECHPGLNQKKLIQFCKERQVTITAFCPIGRPKIGEKKPDFYFSDKTKAIADKYKKTPAQVVLRFMLQIGTIPIPKSSNEARIRENIDIFDFKLDSDDMAVMESFNNGQRLEQYNLIRQQNHKNYPFNIEF